MDISSTLVNFSKETLRVEYSEGNPLNGLEGKMLQSVHAFCVCGDKMVLVNHPKSGWMPPGGRIESGETWEQAVIREVKEETNMRVVKQRFMGFQDVYERDQIVRQVRSFCIVEPYGDFVSDPDGDIMEICLIVPKESKSYFDWGKVGDRLMERFFDFISESKR